MFLMLLMGFALVKTGLLKAQDSRILSVLLLYLALPCAILDSFQVEYDLSLIHILIEKNLGLVHHIVKRFAGRGYEMEDLFQIGTIGLIKAIDKFDLSYDCLLYTSRCV